MTAVRSGMQRRRPSCQNLCRSASRSVRSVRSLSSSKWRWNRAMVHRLACLHQSVSTVHHSSGISGHILDWKWQMATQGALTIDRRTPCNFAGPRRPQRHKVHCAEFPSKYSSLFSETSIHLNSAKCSCNYCCYSPFACPVPSADNIMAAVRAFNTQ